MKVIEIIQSSLANARLHFRRCDHLLRMTSSPSPIVRIAAKSMLVALKNDPGEDVFEDLEHDFRLAGHTQVADAVGELASILEHVLGKKPKQA